MASIPEPAGRRAWLSTEPQSYRSYLLRLWRVPGEATATWRASLESPHTGERWGFADLEELVAFLRRQIDLAQMAWGEEMVRDEG